MSSTFSSMDNCRVIAISITKDENMARVSVSWDTNTCMRQVVLSLEKFRHAVVRGAMLYGHDDARVEARFTDDSQKKMDAIAACIVAMEKSNKHISARSFSMSWAF